MSELSFQFYHRFLQPSLQFRGWLAARLSAMSRAAQVKNSQVVLGLGREGEMGFFSQPNLPLPTVVLPLVWAHQGSTNLINRTYARTVVQWQEAILRGLFPLWTFIGSIPAEDTCVYELPSAALSSARQTGISGNQEARLLFVAVFWKALLPIKMHVRFFCHFTGFLN